MFQGRGLLLVTNSGSGGVDKEEYGKISSKERRKK
jgi:hypothetical protein